jgi:hypothetical protein
MAEATPTTRPTRTRAAKPAAAKATKAATPKAASAPTPPVTEDGKTRITLELEHAGPTKTYEKFTPPASSGCVGQFYAPLGTETVKVLLIGPAE